MLKYLSNRQKNLNVGIKSYTENLTVLDVIGNSKFTGIVTATSLDGNLNSLGKTYYVSKNGSNLYSGNNINRPFASLSYALSVATSGDTILVQSGTFTEVFPLTVPAGVTVRGAGLRATFIQPTVGTRQNDGFLLNGETTVEDLTIGNIYEPGYAFKFANNSKTTIRSPYIQRVTVLNKGSIITSDDPYGFNTTHSPPTSYKAGRGVLIDGSVVDPTTLEPAMLFNECTFIIPNNTALEMTNGARTEWVNCFTYFADKGIYAYDGNVGLGSVGYARIKTSGFSGTTPTANDEIYYLEANSQSGTYNQVGTAITITKVGHGLTVGDRIFADFTSGTATDGYYSVTGYVGVNTFVVTSVGSATTNGNISYKEALGFGTITSYDVSSGLSSITGKGEGLFELPSTRFGKIVTAYGNASLSTSQEKFGTASLLLDGTGDYVRCEGGTDFTFSENFTVETWIYPTSVTGTRYLFSLGSETTDRYNLALVSGVVTGNFYGSASTTFGGLISTNTWSHIALVRSGSTITVYLNGTALGTTETNSSVIGNTGQLTIGADTGGANTFVGYIDEFRISNSARYTGNFSIATSQFNSDGSDKLLLHFDGVTGSTSFIDSSIPTQDIRWVRSGITTATATKITLADYQQFGAEMRSIGSAAVFGNTGVTANGPGVTLRLFAFNFGHIGSGKDFSQDVSLVTQEDEIITSNNGKVYSVSIDQSGDFRVGDAFYVNQEAGTVNFGGQDFTLNSLSDLNITDGTNTTTITPTTATIGNIQISGNEITSTSGDITINPSGNSKTNVSGDLNVIGILTASVLQANALQLGDSSVSIEDTGSNGTVKIYTDNTEALRVTNIQNVGIGTTNPTSKLDVVGDGKFTGIVTATTFSGAFQGNATTATTLQTPRSIALSGDIVGEVLFDGSQNVSIAATIQPNSVTLGDDTTGNYVATVSDSGLNDVIVNNSGTETAAVTLGLTTTGIIPGSYGSITAIPTFTVDSRGRLSAAGSVNVSTALTVTGGSGSETINLLNESLSITGNTHVSTAATNNGVQISVDATSVNTGGTIVSRDSSGNFNAGIITATTFSGALQGNASTASTLQTSRTIALTGDVVGEVLFDGSSNVSIAATIQPNSVTLGEDTTGNYVATVADSGLSDIVVGGSGTETASVILGLSTTGVTAGSYGSTSTIPTFTVDSRGRLTAVGVTNVSTALTVTADSGSEVINLLSETLTISGGTNLTSSAASDTVTINLDDNISLTSINVSGISTVSTLFGTNLSYTGIATINQLDVNQLSPDGVDYGEFGRFPKANGSGGWEWAEVPGLFSVNNILNGFNVKEEGAIVGTAGSITTLDFRGGNILASADPQPNGIATIRVSDTPNFNTLNVSGVSTFSGITTHTASLFGTQSSFTGIVTALSFRPSSGYYQSANGTNSFYVYDGTGNVAFQGTIGASKINNASGYLAIDFGTTSTPTVIVPNNLNVSGLTTLGVTTTTSLTVQQLNVSGLSTFSGIVTYTNSIFGTDANFSGIITAPIFSGNATSATYATLAGLSTSVVGGIVDVTQLNVTGISTFGNIGAGIVTATQFSTGASGSSINITSNTISGPSEITIDPAAVGDNTGVVRIKGDLFVDGTQTIINSTTIELADFIVGIASTATTDSLADGAGIKIGPDNTILYNYNSGINSAFRSSENFDLASGKSYYINGNEVLSATKLGSNIVNSSLTSVGTLEQLNVSGITTASRFVSTVSTGTAPLSVASTTKVSNLNVDLLDDQDGTYYLNYNNFTNTPTIGDGTLTLSVSGIGLTGSQTFTANQTGSATFTVTSNATSDNTNGALVARDSSGGFSVGIITASSFVKSGGTSSEFLKADGSVDTNVYLTSYTEVDTLDSVTGRGNSTTNGISVGVLTATSANFSGIITSSNAYVSGSIGIGTTNPQYQLDVVGDINFTGTFRQNGTQFVASRWTSGTGDNIYRMDGNVGVGTTNPTSKLTVEGDVFISGIMTSTDYNSASDINLKTDIQKIENPLDKVVEINGVGFTWKESGRRSMGVIAQDIEKVLPELVSGDETKTVNYNGLIGLLIECVKEQQKEIEILKQIIHKS